jgi:hypothetical protein
MGGTRVNEPFPQKGVVVFAQGTRGTLFIKMTRRVDTGNIYIPSNKKRSHARL